mgnify:CR=1 FL=1
MSESGSTLTRTKLSESLKTLTKDRKNHKFVTERCRSIFSRGTDVVQDNLNKTSIKCILKAAFRYDSDLSESSKLYFSLLHFAQSDVEQRGFIISTALRYLQKNLKDSTKGIVTDNAVVCPRVDMMRLIGKNALRKEHSTTAQAVAETMLALSRSRKYDLALKMFEKHKNVCDTFCYNLAIESAAQCGLASRIVELVRDMRERRVEPNRHTYFKLLSAAQHLDMQGDAEILIEMLENRTDMSRVVREHKRTREIICKTIKRCGPSAATRIVELITDSSSSLLDEKIASEFLLNLIRYGSTTRALSTFEDFWERGVIPEMHVLVRLVDALGRTSQHASDALRIFRLCTNQDKLLFGHEITFNDGKLVIGFEEFPCGFVKTVLASSILEFRDDLNRVDIVISPLRRKKCVSEDCSRDDDVCSSISKWFDKLSDGEGTYVDDRSILSFQISKKNISEEDVLGTASSSSPFFY